MKKYLFMLLAFSFTVTAHAGPEVGKLTGRDAAAFGAFMTKQNTVTDTHYGAHPTDPATFFKGVFDTKSCDTATPFKTYSMQIKVGHLYCTQSSRSVADISCTAEDEKKTKKINLTGEEAYVATEFMQKAGIKSTKTPSGIAYAAYTGECTYEGVQNCLSAVSEKAGRCRFW